LQQGIVSNPDPNSNSFSYTYPYFDMSLCFLEATPIKQPTVPVNLIEVNGQNYLLVEDTKSLNLAGSDTAEIENCTGLTDISQTSIFSKESSSTVEIGSEGSMDIGEVIKFSIAAHYNLQLGTTTTNASNISLLGLAGHRVTYTIEWYEIWVEGRIIPIANLQSGEKIEIPYRAKIGLSSKVRNPIPEFCAPTPTPPAETITPLPTYTLEPTITATETQTLEPSITPTLESTATP
jgi:hypothetical protein